MKIRLNLSMVVSLWSAKVTTTGYNDNTWLDFYLITRFNLVTARMDKIFCASNLNVIVIIQMVQVVTK